MLLREAPCGAVEPLLYLDYISWSMSQSSYWGSAARGLCWYGENVGVVLGGPVTPKGRAVPCILRDTDWDVT